MRISAEKKCSDLLKKYSYTYISDYIGAAGQNGLVCQRLFLLYKRKSTVEIIAKRSCVIQTFVLELGLYV